MLPDSNDREVTLEARPHIEPYLRRTCAAMDPQCSEERSATRDYVDYLDELQAIYQTGIGLARLELSGVSPDPARAMAHLNQSVQKSDDLRRLRHA